MGLVTGTSSYLNATNSEETLKFVILVIVSDVEMIDY